MDDPNFSIELDSTWQRLHPEDCRQYTFNQRDITVILSAGSHDIAPRDLDYFCDLLVDMQLQSETMAATACGQTATVYEPVVVPRPWGRAIAYYGHDGAGRQFNFSTMMTCRCRISLYMWSNSRSEAELLEAMDDLSSRLVFDRTPLPADQRFD